MKPFDIVKTPKGNLALVEEVSDNKVNINFLKGGNPDGEKNSWWVSKELTIITNVNTLLSNQGK